MNRILSRAALSLYDRITGRHILARLDELNRTQWLSRDELLSLQHDKLIQLLEYAYQYVPFYREVFDSVGFLPNRLVSDFDSYLKVPILTKDIINDHFSELITTHPRHQKHLSRNFTGGSTGQRLVFIQDNNFRDYFTADILRHIGWAGLNIGECHAYVWGTDYEVSSQKALRSRLMDWLLNRFITNAFSLSEESMMIFSREVVQKKPLVLYGYSSALTRYAEFVKAHHLDNIQLLCVISSAELLFPYQREIIERTFKCQVLNMYATRELGCLACECKEHHGLHVSHENVYLEILKDQYPVHENQDGDIVATNLNNYGMPLIRYQVGDVGQLGEVECPCGRGLPMMKMVQGRTTT